MSAVGTWEGVDAGYSIWGSWLRNKVEGGYIHIDGGWYWGLGRLVQGVDGRRVSFE